MSEEIDEKALDEFIREAYGQITAFYSELNGENSRAAAILIVARIDQELSKIIGRYFPADVNEKVWQQLFGPSGVVGSLRNKCLMAEALGAFGPQTRKTIEKMGEIRNKFAHEQDVRAFDHPKVLKLCRELGDNPIYEFQLLDSNTESEIRAHFITAAKCLHERLEMVSPTEFGLGDPNVPLP